MITKSMIAIEAVVILALLVVPLPRPKPPEIDHPPTEHQQIPVPVPVIPPPPPVEPVAQEVQQQKEVAAEKHVSVDDLLKKFSRIEKKLDGVVVSDERAK